MPASLPPPTGAAQPWTLGGAASYVGTDLRTAPVGGNNGGCAVFDTPIRLDGLSIAFQTESSGGSGADGHTLSFCDAAIETVASIVASVGTTMANQNWASTALEDRDYGGTNIVAIFHRAFHNNPNNVQQYGVPQPAPRGIHNWTVTVSKYSSAAPGWHEFVVTRDGTALFDAFAPAPDEVLLTFSGGSGGSDDNHYIRNVSATYWTETAAGKTDVSVRAAMLSRGSTVVSVYEARQKAAVHGATHVRVGAYFNGPHLTVGQFFALGATSATVLGLVDGVAIGAALVHGHTVVSVAGDGEMLGEPDTVLGMTVLPPLVAVAALFTGVAELVAAGLTRVFIAGSADGSTSGGGAGDPGAPGDPGGTGVVAGLSNNDPIRLGLSMHGTFVLPAQEERVL